MARSALYEESAFPVDERRERRWYQIFHIASYVFLAIAVIMVFLTIILLPSMIDQDSGTGLAIGLIGWFLPLMVSVGMFFLFWKIKRRFNVSYDYTFVEDELRVTKVFSGKSRRHLVTIDAKQILKVGYADKPSFDRVKAGLRGKKPVYFTPNTAPAEGKIRIYIYCSSSIENKLYVLECRKELLEYVVFAAGRNKFDPQ